MTLWGDFPIDEFFCCRSSGENLTIFFAGINLHEHEFARLLKVLQLRDQRDVVCVHIGEPIYGGLIWLGVFVLGITTV